MGLFDLLRGYAPIGPEDFALNPDNWPNNWTQITAPPPFRLPDPTAFGWPNAPELMLLPDQPGTWEGADTTLGPDRSSAYEGEIPLQLLAGADPPVWPGDLAQNSSNQTIASFGQPARALQSGGFGHFSSPDDFIAQRDISSFNDSARTANPPTGLFAGGLAAGAATAPGISLPAGLSAGNVVAGLARFGGPFAFLSALLYPSSTAVDDTCENGRCNSNSSEENPPEPPATGVEEEEAPSPPAAGSEEEDATAHKGDATTREGAPFSWIHKDRHTSNDELKGKYEEKTGEVWPIDPETGRDMDVHHEDPLADGGMDVVSKIQPLPRREHIELHKKAGDFARWRQRRGGNRGNGA